MMNRHAFPPDWIRRGCTGLLLSAACVGLAWPCAADDAPPPASPCIICRTANNPKASYAEKSSSTLTRGALNTVFGWVELLEQPADTINTGGNLLSGVGQGLTNTVTRTARGVGELLTFWIPKTSQPTPPLITDCPICRENLKRRQAAKAASSSTESPPASSQ